MGRLLLALAAPLLSSCLVAHSGRPLVAARDGSCTVTDFKTDGSIVGTIVKVICDEPF
jgi:hypothetical protein